ncbi:hypothetical protein [Paraburkholderia sp. BL17N1]|uniref:hypothetical protein n=1 Tax=Paraburkholderia sp. BL17N1 TaxID=1938798 RepID=UPI000F0D5CB0|nr:hypothetical protein [Paraburkholderia sp. BL17N1]RKR43212.1 hypothetical protein B0G82_0764 [Paraburkholderia sp. BL17N1]
MNALFRLALLTSFFLVANLCHGAVVWKTVDVAEYTENVDGRGPFINRIVAIEVVGPPRSVAEGERALLKYAQDTVDMAMAAALAAFWGTPGEIGVKASAAFAHFKGVIAYRASTNAAFREIARFDMRVAERQIASTKLVLRIHFPVAEISSAAANELKKAFPGREKQIQQLSDAYTYFEKLKSPDVDISWDVAKTANRLNVPEEALRDAVENTKQFVRDGPESVKQSVENSRKDVVNRLAQMQGGDNSVINSLEQLKGGNMSVVNRPEQLKGGDNSVVNRPEQLKGGDNSVVNRPEQIKGGDNSVVNRPEQLKGGDNSVINKPEQLLRR